MNEEKKTIKVPVTVDLTESDITWLLVRQFALEDIKKVIKEFHNEKAQGDPVALAKFHLEEYVRLTDQEAKRIRREWYERRFGAGNDSSQ